MTQPHAVLRRPHLSSLDPPRGVGGPVAAATQPHILAARQPADRRSTLGVAAIAAPTVLLVVWGVLTFIALTIGWVTARGSVGSRLLVGVGVVAAMIYVVLLVRARRSSPSGGFIKPR